MDVQDFGFELGGITQGGSAVARTKEQRKQPNTKSGIVRGAWTHRPNSGHRALPDRQSWVIRLSLLEKEVLRRRSRAHAMQTMEIAKTNDGLVVGFDVTRPTEPYSVIFIVKAPPPNETG